MKTKFIAAAAIVGTALIGSIAVPSSAEAGQWKRCNHEGGFCNNTDKSTHIRYGLPGNWIQIKTGGGQWCTNAAFKRDPIPGRRKYCEIYEPSWVWCADEGGHCRTSASGWLSYGVNGQSVERQFAANTGFHCHNGSLGDPAPGKRKSCWVWK